MIDAICMHNYVNVVLHVHTDMSIYTCVAYAHIRPWFPYIHMLHIAISVRGSINSTLTSCTRGAVLSKTMPGQFLPLAKWAHDGFDSETIKAKSLPDDVIEHAVLGTCYRVSILEKTERGIAGTDRGGVLLDIRRLFIAWAYFVVFKAIVGGDADSEADSEADESTGEAASITSDEMWKVLL